MTATFPVDVYWLHNVKTYNNQGLPLLFLVAVPVLSMNPRMPTIVLDGRE